MINQLITNEWIVEGTQDLLTNQNWSMMPGVESQGSGLLVHGVGMEIVSQDGALVKPNHPINIYGPRIDVVGDFQITATIQDIHESAVLEMYGKVPRIYDELRVEQGSVRLNIEDGMLYIDLWDGIQTEPYTAEYAIGSKDLYEVSVLKRGNTLHFDIDGTEVGSIDERGIFNNGTIWFGLDSDTVGGEYILSTLSASPLNGGQIKFANPQTEFYLPSDDPYAWQKILNTKGIEKKIGAAVALGPLIADSAYKTLASSGMYGTWTTENALKASHVHPQPGVYTFGEADAIVELAARHNITIHGHALVFGESNPSWMQDSSPQMLESIMNEHIYTIITRYSGKINSWDVVNEPLSAEATLEAPLREHIWFQSMGEEYIDKAFRAARSANPEAVLFINEYGLEADGARWDAFMKLLEELLVREVPIDGVGFQAHVDELEDQINVDVLRSHFKQIEALGRQYNRELKVRISELDVADLTIQDQQYVDVFNVCLDEPNCVGVTMWGISEDYGAGAEVTPEGTILSYPGLPFTANKEPMPVVARIQELLLSK